ncbi:Phage portal protein, SPP1 Gp6-like [anaerobic digester metagenome]
MQLTQTELINAALSDPARAPMKLNQIIGAEIREFMSSPHYDELQKAESYYRNRSDVQSKANDLKERSNTKIEHSIYRRLVDQKVRYLLSRPWSVSSEDKAYGEQLDALFDSNFRRKIRRMGKSAVKSGVGWLQPYLDGAGQLAFMLLPATEVIPLWADGEQTKLDGFIRFYRQVVYIGDARTEVTRAEYWNSEGVRRFTDDNSSGYFHEDDLAPEAHFQIGDQPYNWATVPLIWLRYNDEELPLLRFVQELIDDYNWQTSVTSDVLRDVAKFIFVLRNYGGADIEQFVTELRRSLAIQVDGDGGVDTIKAEVDVAAVLSFLDKERRDLYEFAAAVDTKDPDLGNASGKAIGFRYMDLDSDCTDLGAELSASFERLKPFIDTWLQATGKGDFTASDFDIVFNKDMPIDETEIIANINTSAQLLSKRTLLENHPWVTDVDKELDAIRKDREESMKEYGDGLFEDPDAAKGGELSGAKK